MRTRGNETGYTIVLERPTNYCTSTVCMVLRVKCICLLIYRSTIYKLEGGGRGREMLRCLSLCMCESGASTLKAPTTCLGIYFDYFCYTLLT